MVQLQVDIPEELATWIQQEAKDSNVSVSEYVDRLLQQERKNEKVRSNGAESNGSDGSESNRTKTIEALAIENGWPKDFLELYGSSRDAPMERPDQGEFEVRETMV